jgi:hypothetical protein
MLNLRRAAWCAALIAGLLLASATPALAGGGGGWVTCTSSQCTVGVGTGGGPPGQGDPGPVSTSLPLCNAGMGEGYLAVVGQVIVCVPFDAGPLGGLPLPVGVTGPPGAGAPPAPAVLALAAVRHLGLTSPVIEASPPVAREQLVNVPTWLWLASSWQPVTATAAVPGEKVTAVATPVSVSWQTGDGSQVTCDGPGTPWKAGDNPASSSPTCGHTYTEDSATAPGGMFTLAATITWRVTWAGAGKAGVINGLTTTAHVRVLVVQAQAIVTGTSQ